MMNKSNKTFVILSIDVACLMLAFGMAYLFRFDFDLLHKINIQHASHILGVLAIVYIGAFFVFKMHRVIWRYVSLNEMIKVTQSIFSGFVVSTLSIYTIFGFHYVPLSILPLQAFFYWTLIVGSHSVYRLYRGSSAEKPMVKKVLIIGAGNAAEGLIRDMLRHTERGYEPLGLLDDDAALHRRSIHGVRVLGPCSQLADCLDRLLIDIVVVAIPSLDENDLLNQVFEVCSQLQVPVRVLPGLKQLADGRVNIDALRRVDIEDLLGREPVGLMNAKLVGRLQNKVVMVTGGGGSIGSELCRQIAINQPKSLFIIDNNEFNLYKIKRELLSLSPDLNFSVRLVDIANEHEVSRCVSQIKPHIIFHAAAFKHVPLLENQAFAAVKNNVIGTRLLADLADSHQVEDFVLVSTDKAVNPTNIMGMTKRIAEIYCQNKNKCAKTNYITVRFGNVLGSTGSVLPLFRQQLAKGGPLTVTHPDMTRYFMMIPESVVLILQAFVIGQGAEIFVLDMGKPVKILDLAEKLISLSGKIPYQQVDIQFTGIRPGEKLFEELFYDSEDLRQTDQDKIFESISRDYNWENVSACFKAIECHYHNGEHDLMLREMLQLVPEYKGQYQSLNEGVPV